MGRARWRGAGVSEQRHFPTSRQESARSSCQSNKASAAVRGSEIKPLSPGMENKEALAVVARNTDAAGLMARPTTQPSIRCMHRQLAVVHPDCCFPVAEKTDWVFQNVPDMIGGDLTGQRWVLPHAQCNAQRYALCEGDTTRVCALEIV